MRAAENTDLLAAKRGAKNHEARELSRRAALPAALLCAASALISGCSSNESKDPDPQAGGSAQTGTGGAGSGGTATGGTAGRGGTATGGGSSGSGSAGKSGSGTGGSGAGAGEGNEPPSCKFEQESSVSPKIATVGIVTFSTTLPDVESARIEFGLTTAYGMTAPVDLTQANNRTLLLGMKSDRLYHYRITATNESGECQSEDYTIMTGPLANGLVKPQVTTNDPGALAGGFIITGQYVQNESGSGPAYIVDSDGDIVWWYSIEDYVTGVVMNYAGTHMWINNHPPNLEDARVHRVSMDGLTDEDLTSEMSLLSHQLTILPDETVAFYADDGSREQCSDIKERAPDGTVRTLANSQTAMGTSGLCHVNDIQYSPDDDTLIFSDHVHCAIAKIRRTDGSTVWVLNGETSSFTGGSWFGSQHGIHVLGVDDLLIFNNNSRNVAGANPDCAGDGDGSQIIQVKLDLDAETATQVWSYKASGIEYQTDIMGDLQLLWNGNYVVAFGGKGVIQEVTSDGTVVQELKTTTNFGYIQKRETLYGPPPR